MQRSRVLKKSLIQFTALCTFLVFQCATAADSQSISIAYYGESGTASEKGAKRGILEANLQGEFLGVKYELQPIEALDTVASTAPRVIIVAASNEDVLRLASKFPQIPVINILSSSDRLRAECIDNLFHTIPSQQMFSDALAQWRSKHPNSSATAQAWHHKFRKYAAAQLNGRYQETFDTTMNDAAWAGWAATKLVADTLIRSPTLSEDALLAELKTNLAFDGQKGIDMRFRETGQLAQPLLLIEGDKIVGEAPVRGVESITDLDTLGEVNCPK